MEKRDRRPVKDREASLVRAVVNLLRAYTSDGNGAEETRFGVVLDTGESVEDIPPLLLYGPEMVRKTVHFVEALPSSRQWCEIGFLRPRLTCRGDSLGRMLMAEESTADVPLVGGRRVYPPAIPGGSRVMGILRLDFRGPVGAVGVVCDTPRMCLGHTLGVEWLSETPAPYLREV